MAGDISTNPLDLGAEPGTDVQVEIPVTLESETVRFPVGEYALRTTQFTDVSDPHNPL